MDLQKIDYNALFNKWQGACTDVLRGLLHNPENHYVFLIFIVGGYLACRWAFIRVVHTTNMNDLGMMRFHATTILGLGAVILSLAAARIYMPAWYGSDNWTWYAIGITAAASIVLSVPLINTMLKESYFKTLLAWSLSLLAIVAAVVVLSALNDAFFAGAASYKKAYDRNEETRQMLK